MLSMRKIDTIRRYPDLTIQKGKLLNGSVTGDTLKGCIE